MEYFNYALSIKDRIFEDIGLTFYMLFLSAIFSGIFGLIIGVILVVTNDGGILENKKVYSILDKITNLFRAVPFIILLAVISPLTNLIVGTRIGPTAAIVPLVFSCVPFFAKQVEQALAEVDPGVIEAAEAMGNSPFEIITAVYLREGLPSLVRASAITLISLLGLTAMAGTIGAGGIGNLAIAVGYNRYKNDVVIISVIVILIIVYAIQGIANLIIKKTSH
ncbi:methionine ABC transporter permease [Anaerococcus rubeinfantis]|uniref:methionine ABC transporter permease n=1 Tax=Anaerococcus rubeinfantis TaxID=1720199 RepID=UPI00073F9F5B|nr:methionine ABC transporter permease [Anaerococcus rubeinfantis]KWZ95491.1 putative D-methionine transport system permease protein MetI [Anaerococcus hydrogenalis]MDU5913196.1 methionine ABC transporter permease [Anaerococcus vaginalis]MDU6063708.1 methionine ABC transporter permease [Anaerococcus sp.]